MPKPIFFMILEQLIFALWILLPAYTANGTPPIVKKGHPIDFGKNINGKRILGDGKTWEGTTVGMLAGIGVGLIESYFNPNMSMILIILIPSGALIGDMIESFFKRQSGMKRGSKLIFFDQLDFIIGVIVFTWLLVDYTISIIAVMLIITYFLHRITSIIGFKMNIKKEPW